MRIHYNHNLKQKARDLRKHSTLAEVLLWNQLKSRGVRGYPFMRQKPIGNYIVDFYCSRLQLVIEIDGGSHAQRAESDKTRQDFLESLGLTVIRFCDIDVKMNMPGCFAVLNESIDRIEAARIQPPNPLC